MIPRHPRILAAGLTLTMLAAKSSAAQDTLTTVLRPVVVTVTRSGNGSVLDAPFALTVITPDSSRPGQRHAAVDEKLALVPGLSVNNRNNPSQDPRVAIRGFGARSAFGVRGIRIMRDGMPLTLPDGQTPLDYLSLESVGRIEVMRGAASALYGNASGGVIDIRTITPPAQRLAVEARHWAGRDAYRRTAIVGGGSSSEGKVHYQGDLSLTRTDGSRAHAAHRATSVFARAGALAGGTDYALLLLGLDMPVAENPGAITAEQLRTDSRGADALSIRKDARKAVKQIQSGISATRALGNAQAALSLFGGARSLDNPLTFAVVEIGRHSHGAGVRITKPDSLFNVATRITGGIDVQWQNDLRRNYVNCFDDPPLSAFSSDCPDRLPERGIVTLDQRELVSSAGLFVNSELAIGARSRMTVGARADRVRFEVRDRLVSASNPDDSGTRTLGALTPIVGVISRIAPSHSAYANISAAFETPTATELGNRSDGSAGINPDLEPQRSTTYEAGVRGGAEAAGRRVGYDVAAFATLVRDELVPFEIPGSDGRRYFRNAGRTRRSGAEFGISADADPLSFQGSYNYSRFFFARFETGSASFHGNEIPGTPRHRAQVALTLSISRVFGVLETEFAGRAFVDDANSVRAPGYEVAHVRAGGRGILGIAGLSATLGVQNVFDRRYASSLAVNAARGKYFEPAPVRSVYAGLSLGGKW